MLIPRTTRDEMLTAWERHGSSLERVELTAAMAV
jgi:hypothetical protein